jgi:hypothetical protein
MSHLLLLCSLFLTTVKTTKRSHIHVHWAIVRNLFRARVNEVWTVVSSCESRFDPSVGQPHSRGAIHIAGTSNMIPLATKYLTTYASSFWLQLMQDLPPAVINLVLGVVVLDQQFGCKHFSMVRVTWSVWCEWCTFLVVYMEAAICSDVLLNN